MRPRVLLAVGLIVASCLATPPVIPGLLGAESLPNTVSDREFWRITTELSEADGYFRSDNLLSNEIGFPRILPELLEAVPATRVYLGVGPEQNFNYIAALKPRMVFIIDVRRRNLNLHLMYKALFELSADRAEFVSRLFSRLRPPGLTAASTPAEIFDAFSTVPKNETFYAENLKAISSALVDRRGFQLSSIDLNDISYVYGSFYAYGPDIRYSSSQGGSYGGRNQPTYSDLMTASGIDDRPVSYLASEERFRTLKDLESKNLIVPIVGNFGGPKALKAVGQYLKDHDAVVSAFYLSNVEMYLNQQGLWDDFCRNVAALPLDETSTFIRSARAGWNDTVFGLTLALAPMAAEVQSCR